MQTINNYTCVYVYIYVYTYISMMHKQTHIHTQMHEILQLPSITRQLEYGQTPSCIENTMYFYVYMCIYAQTYTHEYTYTRVSKFAGMSCYSTEPENGHTSNCIVNYMYSTNTHVYIHTLTGIHTYM